MICFTLSIYVIMRVHVCKRAPVLLYWLQLFAASSCGISVLLNARCKRFVIVRGSFFPFHQFAIKLLQLNHWKVFFHRGVSLFVFEKLVLKCFLWCNFFSVVNLVKWSKTKTDNFKFCKIKLIVTCLRCTSRKHD